MLIALISGGMEVLGTLLGFFAVSFATAIMPFALAFAGGSMMYIIIDEMIPQTHIAKFGSKASFSTLGGFCTMLVLDAVLEMDLPFRKVGLAHLTCALIAPTREEYKEVLRLIPHEEMKRLFEKAAKLGVGIELNSYDMNFEPEEADIILRPYRIAKECGCKFYLGSDAHHPDGLDGAKAIFERTVDLLELTEDDKFVIPGV